VVRPRADEVDGHRQAAFAWPADVDIRLIHFDKHGPELFAGDFAEHFNSCMDITLGAYPVPNLLERCAQLTR
jgi:hypothetical protein